MTNRLEWRDQIEAYVDAELPPTDMDAFRVHAKGCAACAASALAITQSKMAVRRAASR
jgi:anti-sigma factor RsiW